jgi:hypothetical protein
VANPSASAIELLNRFTLPRPTVSPSRGPSSRRLQPPVSPNEHSKSRSRVSFSRSVHGGGAPAVGLLAATRAEVGGESKSQSGDGNLPPPLSRPSPTNIRTHIHARPQNLRA